MDFPTDKTQLTLIGSLVRKAAKRLKRYPILSQETENDLFQDLYVSLLESWKNYDPGKGELSHFIRCILKRKALNILRNHCRRKRPNPQLQILWDDNVLERRDHLFENDAEQQEYARDIRKRCFRLPPPLRRIAEQLKEKTPYKLSQEENMTRDQCGKKIQQLRPYFEEFAPDFLALQSTRCLCRFL